MTKKDSKREKKEKDLVREVNKDDGIWKAVENKSWLVLEFGIYILLLGFTVFAVGYYTPSVLNKNLGGSKHLEGGYNTIYYNLTRYCDNVYDCVVELDEDDSISYISDGETYKLEVNDASIDLEQPIEEFAVLENDYIATFELVNNEMSKITYYNSDGEEIRTFTTLLSSMGRLDSMNGTYSQCNNGNIEIHEYEMNAVGSFTDEIVGQYESSVCQ